MTLELSQNDTIEDPVARLRTTKVVFVEHDPVPDFLEMPAAEQEISRTAIHEAGHALTYLVHHERFRYVSILPDVNDNSAGRVLGRSVSRFQMDVAVAGMAGELILEGTFNLADSSYDGDVANFITAFKR